MPRPRAQLDTAALARAFAADGLHGTLDRRVAAAAGLAKPTLYARGGDKEELFALAVEAEVERLLDAPGRRARVLDLARALDEHLREAPEGAAAAARHGAPPALAGGVARSLDAHRFGGARAVLARRCSPPRCSAARIRRCTAARRSRRSPGCSRPGGRGARRTGIWTA